MRGASIDLRELAGSTGDDFTEQGRRSDGIVKLAGVNTRGGNGCRIRRGLHRRWDCTLQLNDQRTPP
jgi:hypothetical protein